MRFHSFASVPLVATVAPSRFNLPHRSIKADMPENPDILQDLNRYAQPYRLTRFLILRWLGFVYAVAFFSAARQIIPLIGEHGLLPADLFIRFYENRLHSSGAAFLQFPSIFWFGHSDTALVTWCWIGFALSLVVLAGYANSILMAILWALYMSIVHIGQDWYGYGWEFQLLETGFLGIFLCPLLDPRPFPRQPPSIVILWLYRWLGFRIMLGAGLIKIRGDECWRDFTCLYYHYLTQPIPNPLSRSFHFMPQWFHQFGVAWNHFIELIVPWFSFGPRTARHIAGLLMISFQFTLILSGNLSFLNWLTIIPFLACLDDTLLSRFLPQRWRDSLQQQRENSPPETLTRIITVGCFALLVAFLSIDPVINLCSPRQTMNGSFDTLHLVNTYGAFGSVGRERYEIVFEGTSESKITDTTEWREYDFVAKPGNIYRRPRVIAPYQPRIDWQIWFAAMATPQQYPWTLNFVWKLLHNDRDTLSLLATNPFPYNPPRHIRARYYKYEYAAPGDPSGAFWKRTDLGLWLPPLSTDSEPLRAFLTARGWLAEEKAQ